MSAIRYAMPCYATHILCRTKALYFVAGVYLSEAPSPPKFLGGVVKQFCRIWIWSHTECKSPAVYGLQHTPPPPSTHLQSHGGGGRVFNLIECRWTHLGVNFSRRKWILWPLPSSMVLPLPPWPSFNPFKFVNLHCFWDGSTILRQSPFLAYMRSALDFLIFEIGNYGKKKEYF